MQRAGLIPAELAKEQVGEMKSPTSQQSQTTAPRSATKPTGDKRTSTTDPIRVNWLVEDYGEGHGRIGLTFAPGKSGSSLYGKPWERDLELDLDRLRALYKVDLLVSLIEDHELDKLGIKDYPVQANRRGIAVYRSPVVDLNAPSLDQAAHLVGVCLSMASAGRTVVIHCRGGLGRAGTVGACVLVVLGRSAKEAIAETRAVRKGAIETQVQEAFIKEFAAKQGM